MTTTGGTNDIPGAADGARGAAAQEPEKVYYQGSPLIRGELGKIFLFGVVGILLLAAPFLYRFLISDTGTWPHWLVTLILIVLGLIALVIPLLMARMVRYRITSYRIDYERGLLGKSIDTLELWHVDDIKFGQSLTDRLMGVGTITVYSNDQTTPSLPLRGVPNGRHVFDMLKDRVIAIKGQRGVIKLDSGGGGGGGQLG